MLAHFFAESVQSLPGVCGDWSRSLCYLLTQNATVLPCLARSEPNMLRRFSPGLLGHTSRVIEETHLEVEGAAQTGSRICGIMKSDVKRQQSIVCTSAGLVNGEVVLCNHCNMRGQGIDAMIGKTIVSWTGIV